MNHQITIPQWLNLSQPVRMKLKSVFSIPRSSSTHVQDSTVITDGHTHDDLARISVANMQEYLGVTEENFWTLFDLTLEKINDELSKEMEINETFLKAEKQKLVAQRRESIMQTMVKMEQMASELSTELEGLEPKEQISEIEKKQRGRPKKEVIA